MEGDARELGRVEVLTTAGRPLRLASLWATGPAVLVWLRHFGCLFCLEQTAVLMEGQPRLESAGGRLVLIGNGSPAQALHFQRLKAPTATVLTDPDRTSYRHVGAHRSIWGIVAGGDLRTWRNARRLKVGWGGLQGDPLQLGAALVVAPGDRILFAHINSSLGDRPAVEDLLGGLALAAAATAAQL